MHWRHVISKDLIHWQDLGIAVYPTKPYDINGCFSGSSIEVDNQLYMYYTSVKYTKFNPENIHVTATGDEFLASQSMIISKDGFNFDNINDKRMIIPVFNEGEIGHPIHTRDPKVWKYQDKYYMVIASKYLDEDNKYQGQLLFYVSNDAKDWTFKNNYRDIKIGDMWECPDLFAVNNQQLLIMSPERTETHGYPSHARITSCNFEHENCKLEITGDLRLLDYGRDLYAPQTTTDKDGRRIFIGWLRMPLPQVEKWRGMYIYPRVIEYKNGHIYTDVHPNVKAMFTKEIKEFNYQKPTHIHTVMNNGDGLNIGGYLIKYQDCLVTDRCAVFNPGEEDIDLICQTPKLEQCQLDIYIDQHIVEIYINDGYYVLTNIVDKLDDYIDSTCQYKLKTIDE